MAENTSSESLLNQREEKHLVSSDKKSQKRKHMDFEEMESNATRLLYNDTPEEMESNAIRLLYNDTPEEMESNAIRLLYNDTPQEMESNAVRLLYNDTPEEMEYNAIRLLYNDTPDEESDSVMSSTPKKVESDSVKSSTPKKVKPPPFSKVWSDEDEISILKGMIKFKEETGCDAAQNMAEFRAFILESLTLQTTLIQLREKIRRLKDKYEKKLERGNEARTPHEVQVFQLCRKIWTEQHNSSDTEQPQQQYITVHQNILVNEKHIVPEKGQSNIPEIDPARQLMVDKHKIIPVTGVNWETLNAFWKPLSADTELVINSKPCLSGNLKEVNSRVRNLSFESTNLKIKLATLVLKKSLSSDLGDFPEVLEQEVLRAYLEAKIEHTQLLLNAYNSFIKNHTDEGQSSMSAINK